MTLCGIESASTVAICKKFGLDSLSIKGCPQVQQITPWFQQRRHSEHCTFGIVSHNSNNSTLHSHFTVHRFWIVTTWVVDVIWLQVGLKCFSMRMALDLLHEFANTEVFCLFHNCMWAIQTLWSQCLFPRAVWTNRWIVHSQVSTCLFDLRLRFRLRLCLYRHVQQTLAHNSLQVSPFLFVLSQPNKTSFLIALVSKPGGCSLTGLPVLDKCFFWSWFDLLGVFTTSSNFWTQFFQPIIFYRKSLEEVEVTAKTFS